MIGRYEELSEHAAVNARVIMMYEVPFVYNFKIDTLLNSNKM